MMFDPTDDDDRMIVISSTPDHQAKLVAEAIIRELQCPSERVPGSTSRVFGQATNLRIRTLRSGPLSCVSIDHYDRPIVMNSWDPDLNEVVVSVRGMSMVRAFRWSTCAIFNSQSSFSVESSVEAWRLLDELSELSADDTGERDR